MAYARKFGQFNLANGKRWIDADPRTSLPVEDQGTVAEYLAYGLIGIPGIGKLFAAVLPRIEAIHLLHPKLSPKRPAQT